MPAQWKEYASRLKNLKTIPLPYQSEEIRNQIAWYESTLAGMARRMRGYAAHKPGEVANTCNSLADQMEAAIKPPEDTTP